MLAQLVRRRPCRSARKRAPRCQGLSKRAAAEEIWTTRLKLLSKNETGRLKLEICAEEEKRTRESPSYWKNAGVDGLLKRIRSADTMELIRVTDELYNKGRRSRICEKAR